jgi:hypothetical protein
MERTLIQKYSSSIIRGLIERALDLSKLDHRVTKGELRELFVSNTLKAYLTKQFDVGSGIIINQKGKQSNQTDIIIYDNRVLPPFIKEQQIGVYPAESVIATIEVKSNLTKPELLKSEEAAKKLYEKVYDPESSIYKDFKYFKPLCSTIGFYGSGARELSNKSKGEIWLKQKIKCLSLIGLINKYSWIKMPKGWVYCACDKKTNEEIKRFIAVLLDNIRTHSERRLRLITSNDKYEKHRDLLGCYIRH